MTDEFEQLKREYRKVRASPHLAARVRSALPDRRGTHIAWVPVAVAAVLAGIAVLLVMPRTQQAPPATVAAGLPPSPSLVTLSRMMAQTPEIASPSMAGIRSYPAPKMPAKPVPEKQPDQQGRLPIDTEPTEVTYHG